MLAEARAVRSEIEIDARLAHGDIRHNDEPSERLDAAVCIRFLNWVDMPTLGVCLGDVTRVTRSFLIVGVRFYAPLAELGAMPHALSRFCGRCPARMLPRPLHVHEKREVREALAACRWRGVEGRCGDRRRGGSDSFLYVLEKERP